MTSDKRWRAKFSGFASCWKQLLSLKNCRSVRICSVLNRDTIVYYRLIFCAFSWPNMVKWRNSGIITLITPRIISNTQSFSNHCIVQTNAACKVQALASLLGVRHTWKRIVLEDIVLQLSQFIIFSGLRKSKRPAVKSSTHLPSKKYAYVCICISGGRVAVYVATRSICFSSIRAWR